MSMSETGAPVSVGEPAPDFRLPAVDGKSTVSLADYRGRTPVFLALLNGLWCPFCRRQIVRIGAVETKLKTLGVTSLGVVATAPENAQLYFRFRPTRLVLGADPALSTHQAYRVPRPAMDAAMAEALGATRINPTGELPAALPIMDAMVELTRLDGYTETPTDSAEREHQLPLLKAQYMIDRDGIVRWLNIECVADGLAGAGRFPSDEELLAAAQALH